MDTITKKTLNITDKRPFKLTMSFVFPLLIALFKPMGMDWRQSLVIAAILLVITWWSANIVRSIPASCFLLGIFVLFRCAPLPVIFTFPLSENFLQFVLAYLFSQGIANSGLVDKLFEPYLFRFANTPVKTLLSIIAMYIITIYMIPQPLARLIIVAMLFRSFLSNTTASTETVSILMYACFIFYAVVNMATRNADIIMNNASLAFAGVSMSDGQWIKYMAVPVIIYGGLICALFIFLFRKNLIGIQFSIAKPSGEQDKPKLNKTEQQTLVIILFTILLWMTEGIHSINAILVTFASSLLLFGLKVLSKKDFKAIDVTTLVFLTAAFSIGGVMKACGAADIVFSQLAVLFPKQYSPLYLVIMIFVGVLMHMILGSNITTLSVVVPGLTVICGNVLRPEIIMFVAFNSIAFHSILPFHSAAMMIGYSNGYFPSKYVAKLGIPVTFLLFAATMFLFVPWWKWIGAM